LPDDFYTYKTIAANADAEFKDRGSRFIAYALHITSIEEFKLALKNLKVQHPKAVHHCFAYRIGTDKRTFRAVDDGEPSGSAGKPILGVIDSNGLSNCAVVVVRYFGGTLLGVPGLINAYKSSAQAAIDAAGIISKEETNLYELEFDYTIQSAVNKALHQLEADIIRTENLLFCKLTCEIKKRDFAQAGQLLDSIHNLQYKMS
jgi:uncharacterized YigZ family protein